VRVFTDSVKRATQVEQFGAIQMQRLHCRPTRGGATENQLGVFAPSKVARPRLAAWIEERHDAPRLWVTGVGLGVLVAITRLARPSQLSRSVTRAMRAWQDMFTDKR